MINEELRARIRRYFYAENWKIGAIAAELGVHADTVRNAIEASRFQTRDFVRASIVDPYTAFIRDTLEQHPRLRATRIFQMIHERGYSGSVVQLRRAVARMRPQVRDLPGGMRLGDVRIIAQIKLIRERRRFRKRLQHMPQQFRVHRYLGLARQSLPVDAERAQEHIDMRKIFHKRPTTPVFNHEKL